uniref:CxC1-like cysteine cluster associated with KDZ transposases domain-containing protein n=1 Tax=Moniliophthora roreri TaxID=221103 RepID=A0A0W0FGH6_MONRR
MPIFPPGEEGAINSHAGREYSFNSILNSLLEHSQWHADDRIHSNHIQKIVDLWQDQRLLLVWSYLLFKAKQPSQNDNGAEQWPLTTIDFMANGKHNFFHLSNTQTVNKALMQHGYIGASPNRPSLAFLLSLFEIYRQIHWVCPKFSIDRLAQTLQHLHSIKASYSLHLANSQLQLAQQLQLEDQLQVAYDQTSEQLFITTICPPYAYKLEDEPALDPSILLSIDGNNSQKQWLIEEEFVDQFKHEVQKSQDPDKAKSRSSDAMNASSPPNATDPLPLHNSDPSCSLDLLMSIQDEEDKDIAWLNVNEMNKMVAKQYEIN